MDSVRSLLASAEFARYCDGRLRPIAGFAEEQTAFGLADETSDDEGKGSE
jgi:hypothetical protein